MSEIDWSKAPEGATHGRYVEGHTPDFYKMVGDKFCYWDEYKERWMSSHRHVNDAGMVASPCTWTGEGLPPVGTKLECCFAISKDVWREGVVVFRGLMPEGVEFVVVDTGEHQVCYRAGFPLMMRPIRTPEQIAAEEREKAINEMEGIVTGYGSWEVCANLYDAGYRKQEQPK